MDSESKLIFRTWLKPMVIWHCVWKVERFCAVFVQSRRKGRITFSSKNDPAFIRDGSCNNWNKESQKFHIIKNRLTAKQPRKSKALAIAHCATLRGHSDKRTDINRGQNWAAVSSERNWDTHSFVWAKYSIPGKIAEEENSCSFFKSCRRKLWY